MCWQCWLRVHMDQPILILTCPLLPLQARLAPDFISHDLSSHAPFCCCRQCKLLAHIPGFPAPKGGSQDP